MRGGEKSLTPLAHANRDNTSVMHVTLPARKLMPDVFFDTKEATSRRLSPVMFLFIFPLEQSRIY